MPARWPPSGPRRDPVAAALALAGLVVAGYLSWLKWTGAAAAFCAPGSGCDIVQASRHASIGGVPTALLGALTYAVLAALALAGLDPGRWRLAVVLAAAGVGFSGYLTYVSLVELKAACAWCLLSAGILAALLIALAARPPRGVALGGRPAAFAAAAAVSAALAGVLAFAGGPPPATPYQQALARHLAASGAVFYGAYWCPHCEEQKHLFGSAAAALPYVECDAKGTNPQPRRCQAAGVRLLPTWVLGAERREGVQPLEELARLSGFTGS